MAKGLETRLIELLNDPGAAALQADLAQAAALRQQEIALRQRAGAAAAQLRRAKEEEAAPDEIAALQATLDKRLARLAATTRQAEAADILRPQPDATKAQIFGRATGTVDKPPVTAAALSGAGDIVARAVAKNGVFHLATDGDFVNVILQLSDAEARVLYRASEPVTVEAGQILQIEVALGAPETEPGPVPALPKMPDLVGQSEGVALALLKRLAVEAEVKDKEGEGEPDIVIDQSPKAGTELTSSTKVTLTVRRASGKPARPRFLPGLIGKPLDAAQVQLKELGLKAEIERRIDDGPAGLVLAQNPKEGTPIERLDTVHLTVSEARAQVPGSVAMPDLLGQSRAAALDVVKALGLNPKVNATTNPAAHEGVTAQKPAPGTVVKRGATVELTVNARPAPQTGQVVVPALVGLDQKRAERQLKHIGLTAKVQTRSDPAPAGRILAQEPPAGTRIEPGKAVALSVSAGISRGGDLRGLTRTMAADPRARQGGITQARLAKMFGAAGITSLDGARALAELQPAELRDRLTLGTMKAATSFRAMLRKALEASG